MTDPTLIADLIRAGLDAALVQRVAMEIASASAEASTLKSRREADRQRKARQREVTASSCHVTSRDIAEVTGQTAPSPFPTLSPSPLSPTPPIPAPALPPLSAPPPSGACEEQPQQPAQLVLIADPAKQKPSPRPKRERKPKASDADPRHAETVKLYVATWEDFFGEKYAFQSRDAKSLQTLLKQTDKPPDELAQMARWCWQQVKDDRFAPAAFRKANTLHGLCENFSAIISTSTTYKPQ